MTARNDGLLRIVSQNTSRGGTKRSDGRPTDQYTQMIEVVKEADADIALFQEVNTWADNGHELLARTCEELGMATAGIAPSRDGYPVTVLWNPNRVTWKRWNTDCGTESLKGHGLWAFDIGLDKLLTVIPIHLSPYGYEHAAFESQVISSRAHRYDDLIIAGGDYNYPPADEGNPEPLYETMKPWNIGARTLEDEHGNLIPDRRIAEIWRRKGFIDVDWHLYQQQPDPRLLEPTGTDDRIDRFEVTAQVIPGIVSCTRLPTKARGGSDHDGKLLVADPALFDTDTDANWS